MPDLDDLKEGKKYYNETPGKAFDLYTTLKREQQKSDTSRSSAVTGSRV